MREEKFSFPAQTEYLEKLGEFLKQSCDDEKMLPLIELVAAEVVVNAIRHGAARRFEVIIRNDGVSCWLEVIDDGKPFNVLETEPLPLGVLREGGYGLGILHAVAQNLAYERRTNRNHLTITFTEGAS